MKTIKNLCTVLLAGVMVFMLSACSASSSKSYTFSVETGDKIKVTLDTSDGFTLTQEKGHFFVKKDDENILEGIFIREDGYNNYLAIKGEQGMRVIEDKEKDGNPYYMYEIEGESGLEDNYVLWVKDAKTGILMASIAGREQAQAAFSNLTIAKD